MNTNEFNSKTALIVTRLICISMISGLLIFLAAAIYLASEKYHFSADLSDPLIITLLFLSITAIPAGQFLSKRALPDPDSNDTLQNKFPKYQKGLILKMAPCEGVGLFSIVIFLIEANLISFVFLFIALSVMILYFPTPSKIGSELNLSESEIESFTQS
jgi:hypothetical protein